MPTPKVTTQVLGAITLGLSLACGGGGGSSAVSTGTDLSKVQSGTFIDSPVKGLRYQTQSLSGTTDADGRFYYKKGEEVTFYIGQTKLGKSFGGNTLTPAHLVGVDVTSKDRRLVNTLRLLQSTDADANPDNGIEIAEELRVQTEKVELNFDLDPVDFSYSDNTLALLSPSPRALIDGDQALIHFNNTLTRMDRPGADDLSRPMDYASAKEFLTARDLDLSGDLSKEEFAITINASENQVEGWTRYFNALDTNVDAQLSMEEWKSQYQIQGGPTSMLWLENPRRLEDDFVAMDADISGNVNMSEWLNQQKRIFLSQQEEHFKRIFKRMDTDQNARLSLSELEAKPEVGSGLRNDNVLVELDLDGDSTISSSEFTLNVPESAMQQAQTAFASMDSNGDQFISTDELRVNPKKDAQDRRVAAFAQQDADGSGNLSLDEYLAKVPAKHGAKAKEQFGRLDLDKNGSLTEEEMSGMARKRQNR